MCFMSFRVRPAIVDNVDVYQQEPRNLLQLLQWWSKGEMIWTPLSDNVLFFPWKSPPSWWHHTRRDRRQAVFGWDPACSASLCLTAGIYDSIIDTETKITCTLTSFGWILPLTPLQIMFATRWGVFALRHTGHGSMAKQWCSIIFTFAPVIDRDCIKIDF